MACNAYSDGLAERRRLCNAYQDQLVENAETMRDILDILWPSQPVREEVLVPLNAYMVRVLEVGNAGRLDTVHSPAQRHLDDLYRAQNDGGTLNILRRMARLVKRRDLRMDVGLCLDIEHQGWCVLFGASVPMFASFDPD